MKIIVGMADMQVTNDAASTLITYALGSCIGVTIYDPLAKVGGILHYMLPDSKLDPEKALRKPFMFADTAIPLFFKEGYKLGGDGKKMWITVTGGAQLLDDSGYFNIGKRNYLALRKLFWANNILIRAEAVGGYVNRTVRLDMATGKVWVKTSGEEERDIC